MRTPIYDFVKKYAEGGSVRMHMPGHKGVSALGCEPLDITEIGGADVLYSADGIIAESEENLTSLYGTAHSFYSTEGSTLAIKAMLRLVSDRSKGERPLVLAARNVHASFIRGAALLDLDVEFIYSTVGAHICQCLITPEDVESAILRAPVRPCAVYLTSPDYLGNMQDISAIAQVCKRHNIPLLVDNAHGAYLRFLPEDMHPISLGATMCADSAHKTLPVLTGGAYLHISKDYPEYAERAREALSLFASTSPSYLTLASLDLCNSRLGSDYPEKIRDLVKKTIQIKNKIRDLGYSVSNGEPLKIVIECGGDLSEHLRRCGIEVEFADGDYTVLMLTPENGDGDLSTLLTVLDSYQGSRESGQIPGPVMGQRVCSLRTAILSPCESVPVEQAVGRVCASPTVSCPPAVPIVVSGERITPEAVALLKHYRIEHISVLK